jgi:hypothetical protein
VTANAPTKSEILKYLSDTCDRYSTYQNHKEVSAWGGIVLYVVLMAQIAFIKNEALNSQRVMWLLHIVIVILLVAVIIYLRTQLHLRRKASDYVAALSYLSAECLGMDDTEIDPKDWRVIPPEEWDSTTEFQSTLTLPQRVNDLALVVRNVGRRSRYQLEIATYCIVALAFFAALARLWFR